MGLIHRRAVIKVWQGVSGGWPGREVGKGGLATVALGVVTRFAPR